MRIDGARQVMGEPALRVIAHEAVADLMRVDG
jgi:hypothetical protein